MDDFEINKISLAKYSSNKEILSLLIHQLIKDFESCGIYLKLPIDANVELIKEYVYEALLRDVHSSQSKIHQLLYRIDVSENSVGKITDQNNFKYFINSLTDIVIERELKKIITRKYYR